MIIDNAYDLLVSESEKFLHFFKHRFPVFHKSNVFYRDLEYSVRYYLESRNVKLHFNKLPEVTAKFIKYLESQDILRYISPRTWAVNYPEFVVILPQPAEATTTN